MSIIYLINPSSSELMYIYNKYDLKKAQDKGRIVAKVNNKNIKFGKWENDEDSLRKRYTDVFQNKFNLKIVLRIYDISKLREFEKLVSNNCFKNYERVGKTREWMIGIDMKTAESLILKQYDKFK
jgi:peptidyl-tRNA hydrolase|tara:strand:- start:171 stop:545 length:375 start_codon:yes stop_codon:yes gene_type:complete